MKEVDDKRTPNTKAGMSQLQVALRNMIEKKKEDEVNTKMDIFNKVLIETKTNYLSKKSQLQNKNTLRQLATIRVGLKIKR